MQSLRLVIGGRLQRRALDPAVAVWETYLTYALPERALDYVEGFMARVVLSKPLPKRNKLGRFIAKKKRKKK